MTKAKRYDNQRFTDLFRVLKDLNKIKNLKDLAEISGYNYSYLSQINSGMHEYSEEMHNKLSKLFDIDINELPETKTAPNVDAEFDEIIKEQIKTLRVNLATLEALLQKRKS